MITVAISVLILAFFLQAFCAIALLALIGSAAAQPFAPGQGVGPLGGFRTSDAGGPYNLTLLSQQANEVAQGGAARQNFTDADIVDFLVKQVPNPASLFLV